jgi:hypothetical protein
MRQGVWDGGGMVGARSCANACVNVLQSTCLGERVCSSSSSSSCCSSNRKGSAIEGYDGEGGEYALGSASAGAVEKSTGACSASA